MYYHHLYEKNAVSVEKKISEQIRLSLCVVIDLNAFIREKKTVVIHQALQKKCIFAYFVKRVTAVVDILNEFTLGSVT